MKLRDHGVPLWTLVALVAASVFHMGCAPEVADPLELKHDGIGPLQLGRDYEETARAALKAAPATAFAGLGCNGLDEVRYSGELGGFPVSAMGMADQGVIIEVELSMDSPIRASDEAACLSLRDRFGKPFVERFGAPTEQWEQRKPVSREHMARTGPVVLVARWFPTGGSCYVSALYRGGEAE